MNTAKTLAPASAAALPGRSHRFGSPRPSASTTMRKGSAVMCSVPVPTWPPTRSAVSVKSSGQGAATQGWASAAGSTGPLGAVPVVAGAVVALVSGSSGSASEKRYTPAVRLGSEEPGSRMPATATTSSPAATAPPDTAPCISCDHSTSPVCRSTARSV